MVEGAYMVELEPHNDDRGFFARSWSAREFAERGLNANLVECSVSFNRVAGTLRGLHLQAVPHEEAKLVRCTRGAAFDVLVDLRAGSTTYRRHAAVTITADNRRGVYVPEGCAHGFQTLEDATELEYYISTAYVAELARGVRWDDPAFAIEWPLPPISMSDRDRAFPDYEA